MIALKKSRLAIESPKNGFRLRIRAPFRQPIIIAALTPNTIGAVACSKASGATRTQVRDFFAAGMGMTVGAALELNHLFAPVPDEQDCD